MTYRVEFFQPKEFRCPCCGAGEERMSALLVAALDMLRRVWAAPVAVNSGFRCQRHNAEVGGAAQSRHMVGCAADIRPGALELMGPFQNLVEHMFSRIPGWECRIYRRYIHLAVPRKEATPLWTGGVVHLGAC